MLPNEYFFLRLQFNQQFSGTNSWTIIQLLVTIIVR